MSPPPINPFTDVGATQLLYTDERRVARRTGSLHAAKVRGEDAAAKIADLAAIHAPGARTIADVGCGRGTSTLHLARKLRPHRLIAIDQSLKLLEITRQRALTDGFAMEAVRADFHRLPLAGETLDLVVAAFCLYHSPNPAEVVAGIRRCLRPTGHAIIVTKSIDSYREIDRVMVDTGLDSKAAYRPSLYDTFHTANAEGIVAAALRIEIVVHRLHVFRFDTPEQLAIYLSTTPKYSLPEALMSGNGAPLASALRRLHPLFPLTATSTVTYLVAARL
jgi:SAM-dependent methyltransferase